MAFLRANPTQASVSLTLPGTFGAGDILQVSQVGTFIPHVFQAGEDPSEFNQDKWTYGLSVEYDGDESPLLGTAYAVVGSDKQITAIQHDRPLDDNADPNGDYGLEVNLVTLSMSPPNTGVIHIIEGEESPIFGFDLSSAIDVDVIVDVSVSPLFGGPDMEVLQSFTIYAGMTHVDYAGLFAVKDEEIEPFESGKLSFKARLEGGSALNTDDEVAIRIGGQRTFEKEFEIQVDDRVVRGLDAAEQIAGSDWIKGVLDYAGTVWEVGAILETDQLAAAWGKKAAAICSKAGKVIDILNIALPLAARLDLAAELPEQQKGEAVYEALVIANAQLFDEIIGTLALTASAAFVAGAVTFIGGAAITTTAPVLAGVATFTVGAYFYDKLFSQAVTKAGAEFFQKWVNKAEFIELFKSAPKLDELGGGSKSKDNLVGTKDSELIVAKGGNDKINGGGGNDKIDGGGGKDIITASAGTSALSGGKGNDIFKVGKAGYHWIDGGPGTDTLDLKAARGPTEVDLALGQATGKKFSHLFTDVESVVGGKFGDDLVGDDSTNRIVGGSGKDFIEGKGGKDILIGGGGRDTFIYRQADDAIDVIKDFGKHGHDKIDASNMTEGDLTFVGKNAFTGPDQIRINDIAGPDLLVEINVSGGDQPDLTIRLAHTKASSIDASDFIL